MFKELIFSISKADVESFSELLHEQGAFSVTIECLEGEEIIRNEGDIVEAYWDQNRVTALIDAQDEPLFLNLQPLETRIVPDIDWVLEMQKNMPIQVIGDTLWIVPSWHEVPKEAKIVLRLDPKNAFGTGDHPTTHLCLDWLVKNPPIGKSVIDYGCGSGILMIAAEKLGASSIAGYDVDPGAMRVMQQNCKENEIFSSVELENASAPLVLANIHLGPLLSLVERLKSLCCEEGILVLSGILPFQLPTLLETYLPHFSLVSVDTLKGWMRVVLRRQPL